MYIYIYIYVYISTCIYIYIHIYIYIYIYRERERDTLDKHMCCDWAKVLRLEQHAVTYPYPLAIFYPPLKYLGGCFWLFYRLRRETPISQNWPKGYNMATMP